MGEERNKNYDNFNAYVGVHKGTKKELGRLADPELRELKKKAHLYFDYIWKKRIKQTKDYNSRKKAYVWLSQQMKLKPKDTHRNV